MNTINEFATYLADHIFDNTDMADNHTIEIKEVIKNNGLILTGLMIQEDGSNIAPTIYINDAFDKYIDGEDIDDIIAGLLNSYLTHKVPDNVNIDFFTDFNQVKNRIAMKIINFERNQALLSDCPFVKFGDLAAIFQVQVDASEFGNAVITIKTEHMNMWNTNVDTLMAFARMNMEEQHPVHIQSMIEVLMEMMGDDVPEEMLNVPEPSIFVMRSETKINGAAAMIFTDKLQEFAEKENCNFFILPSSIHEILLVPDNGDMSVDNFADMVRSVNDTQVSPDEILSYNVYYYDRFAKELMMAVTKEIIA